MQRTFHFSGLDGIRAVAALAVVFSHITMALNDFGLDVYVFGTYADGNPRTTLLAGFGVSMFFSLSGFLITYLLLQEKNDGGINVRNFYMRRVLRIWPLYYLYLLLATVTTWAFGMPFDFDLFWFYVFLLANVPFILGKTIGLVGHYWSLGVEEQFYSFWPWIIVKSKHLLTTSVILCLGLITATSGAGILSRFPQFEGIRWLYVTLHVTRFQCMFIGAIGAILYFRKHRTFMLVANHYVTQVIVWLMVLSAAINKFHIISLIDNELISLATVFLIVGQIDKTKRIINLDFAVANFIGKISYGIYILHPIVILCLSKIIRVRDEGILGYGLVYGSVFTVTVAIAYLSYTLFEKRFLMLKERYSSVAGRVPA